MIMITTCGGFAWHNDCVVYVSPINVTTANSQLNITEKPLIIFLEQHMAQVLNKDIMYP